MAITASISIPPLRMLMIVFEKFLQFKYICTYIICNICIYVHIYVYLFIDFFLFKKKIKKKKKKKWGQKISEWSCRNGCRTTWWNTQFVTPFGEENKVTDDFDNDILELLLGSRMSTMPKEEQSSSSSMTSNSESTVIATGSSGVATKPFGSWRLTSDAMPLMEGTNASTSASSTNDNNNNSNNVAPVTLPNAMTTIIRSLCSSKRFCEKKCKHQIQKKMKITVSPKKDSKCCSFFYSKSRSILFFTSYYNICCLKANLLFHYLQPGCVTLLFSFALQRQQLNTHQKRLASCKYLFCKQLSNFLTNGKKYNDLFRAKITSFSVNMLMKE
ncbi:hypothetical protein RFI_32378 [Reticulomyxa filosa]|uniref:Uncharacterized protein n=1 Tax=Reticulomyxa filosa TaxID=46433 RepID=X6LV51_RETFI|nr:hypothetical protein RFI_32378 [Reticulomyxa filosa]|eukprot:ETO05017.1 hypothetical protein RFI_32378 [Reticulomyxa filosa]